MRDICVLTTYMTQGYTEVRYDEERKRVVYEPLQLTQAFRCASISTHSQFLTTHVFAATLKLRLRGRCVVPCAGYALWHG